MINGPLLITLANRRVARPGVAGAAVLALATLVAAGCSAGGSATAAPASPTASTAASPASAVNLSSVTLNIGDQKGTGAEAVLTAAGLLSSLPFHVNWSDFTSGPPMLEAMSSGSIDIGGVGDAPPVFAASGGEAIEIVGARETPTGDQDAVVVPKGSPITSIKQLKGKKIAYGSGSSANYNLLTVLTKAGLTTKDVTLVNLQPADALAAFTSGAVDAWDIWPPYVQQVVSEDGARVLAVGPGYGSPYSFEVASKSAVADPAKAAAIKVYLETLDKAYVWAAAHPSAWAVAWGKAAGLPISVMDVAAKVDATTPIAITSAVTASEQNLVDQFYTAGLIPNKVDISGYVSTEFNSTVSGS
jgi:sulfonate transport system substrate-binding protein